MPRRSSPARVTVAFLLLCALPLRAQTFDASHAGGPVTITAPWRFHTGDDPGGQPGWASPSFDDSQWPLLRIDKSRNDQGYKNYSGYAWYRLQLKLPASAEPLALGLEQLTSAQDVFIDGRLAATMGHMRPTPEWHGELLATPVIPIPPALHGHTIQVALRTWESPLSAPGAGNGTADRLPVVATADAVRTLHTLTATQLIVQRIPGWLVAIVAAVIGLFSLGLYALRPRSTEYLWAALWLLCIPLQDATNLRRLFGHWETSHGVLTDQSIVAFGLACWLLFIWRFVGSRADWRLVSGIAFIACIPCAVLLNIYGHFSVSQTYLTWAAVSLLLAVLVFIHLVRLAWRGNRDAQLFLVPFLLSTVFQSVSYVRGALYYFGLLRTAIALVLVHGPGFNVAWSNLFDLLSYLAVAAVLILRFTRSAEQEQRLSGEIESARAVQALLVPAVLPFTPHFHFEAAYIAASEVGGDLYQVFPQPDGGVLVAIGDVSGKGLKAAMLGTLVVGALRALAQENLSPSQILTRLNDQLIHSSDGGFVTCLILRIAPGGAATIANAGHLAPYRKLKEIPIESNLPLGLSLDVTYAETTISLAPRDTLVFVSDGIVEARNFEGELFGFERTRALTNLSASQIAATAQAHGQQDDITVLTLAFAPAEVLHA
jgi:sigma-B regulation protein RsbU (phosphoserine phosphatase)